MFPTSSLPMFHEPTEIAPGALLGGKYRLESLLAEGGMGNVWLARNELIDLPVALKIVRPDARGKETTARLLMEARVQANLRHPNVARVFDYGETPGGDSFLVIELLDGCSLAELLDQQGALPPVQAVKLMLPIIDALCEAHRAGVVHRDIKPDNIFISRTGEQVSPKLLDFGVAKLTGAFNPRLTGNGGVVGSPAYMSPEQARGVEDVDARADVWAVCVVLYEAVSGKPAFDADNYHALLRSVIEHEPAPLTAPECANLWSILRAGLVKNRAHRTETMRELSASLTRWLRDQGEVGEGVRDTLGADWKLSARVEETLVAAGRRALPESGPRAKALGASFEDDRSSVQATLRARRRQRHVSKRAWRMSLAAAAGVAVLAFGFGQVWVSAEEQAKAQEDSVVRPAAASLIAAEPAMPAGARTGTPPSARSRPAATPPPLSRESGALPTTAVIYAGEMPPRTGLASRSQPSRDSKPESSAPARAKPRADSVPLASPPPSSSRPSVRRTAAESVLQTDPPAPSRRRGPATEADLGLKSPW